MAQPKVIATSFALVTALVAAAAHGQAAAPAWIKYRNAATGLSFRYPPALKVHERDPQEFGLQEHAVLVVDLVGDTKVNPGTVVLRFIVGRGELPEAAVPKRLESLRAGCKSFSYVPIDGHQAPVCVSCGRAACHWAVEVLQPRECTILTLLGGADADEAEAPPHDGTFPLRSIIETVHFELPGK